MRNSPGRWRSMTARSLCCSIRSRRCLLPCRRRRTPSATCEEALNEFQPFQLYAVAADLGKVVLGLLHKPAFLVAAENLGQPHGHFGRYAGGLSKVFGGNEES